ncbi:MAG TPA: S41 family peptidase, partial [Candidatus Nitrosocosmicus sp.]|nr:S41 family peptidase [Candidatus Nitrosocosmicus sp.]
MVKPIRVFLVLLVFVFTASLLGCQQEESVQAFEAKGEDPGQLSMEQKLEDFEYMYKVLEENYPFFEVNKRMNGIDWLANNDHTGIIGKQYYSFLRESFEPIKEKWTPWWEQLNMESAVKRNASEQGSSTAASNNNGKYITPNNVDAKLLHYKKVAYLGVKSLNGLNIENDMKIIKPFLESIKDYDALIIDIRQNGGGSSYYWSEHVVPMLITEPIKWTQYFVYRGGAFSEPFIKCLRGSGFESMKPIEEFSKEGLTKAPSEILKDYKYYINAEEIIQPRDSVNFRGKIYILVDSEVYSSSEMWASFAK